ncbi:hypothetical protein NA56DRAFT_747243 [Hyaloscypha hepaticicola]|uniref:Uncharacterized protein n=1 Tax=Hyaloscypha hepaticicola TaxID=2082293 RepID=A0A2J6QAV6_9HELO|nr:hypothetical protein NA56DRAFT_747243 [Hyaloscypha hepaticicola]
MQSDQPVLASTDSKDLFMHLLLSEDLQSYIILLSPSCCQEKWSPLGMLRYQEVTLSVPAISKHTLGFLEVRVACLRSHPTHARSFQLAMKQRLAAPVFYVYDVPLGSAASISTFSPGTLGPWCANTSKPACRCTSLVWTSTMNITRQNQSVTPPTPAAGPTSPTAPQEDENKTFERSTIYTDQLYGDETKRLTVIKRSGLKFPMCVQKDDTTLSLKFVWDVPVIQLPDDVKIHPKDGYLIAQFPIPPYSNAELKNQFAREVVPMTQAHLPEGPLCCTSALQDVTWRHATVISIVTSRVVQ